MSDSDLPFNATDLDLEAFWRENQQCLENPFGKDIARVPFGMYLGYEAAFAEANLKEDNHRLLTDYEFARNLARTYNEKARRIVGRDILNEHAHDPSRRMPYMPLVGELFGCKQTWHAESWWLTQAAHTPAELEKVLDRVEKLDLEAAMFTDDFWEKCQAVTDRHGIRWYRAHHLRGPVTLATSIYGTENLLYLILDQPKLAERFRDVLKDTLIRYHEIADRHGHPDLVQPGFAVYDDNCCLLTPDMYAFFGQPILQALYDRFAPEPGAGHMRYQHSDSDMAHLLPLLAETGMNRVNFGPNVRVRQIREAMPDAVIEGTLAPFTLMRNEEENIVVEVKRDCDEARTDRGLVEATAGSINDGTRLSSLRCVMEALVKYGQYN